MLEQSCNHSKQCRNNVATLCFANNRRCESSRITSPLHVASVCTHPVAWCRVLLMLGVVASVCTLLPKRTQQLPTLSKHIKSVVGTLHLSLRTVKRYERLIYKLWRTVAISVVGSLKGRELKQRRRHQQRQGQTSIHLD